MKLFTATHYFAGRISMHTVSLDQAKQQFETVVARVLANAEPTIVNTPAGDSVIVLPLDDYEAWQETTYLLRTPANAAHLRKSIAEAETSKIQARELAE
jgi:antitoxin YefM